MFLGFKVLINIKDAQYIIYIIISFEKQITTQILHYENVNHYFSILPTSTRNKTKYFLIKHKMMITY